MDTENKDVAVAIEGLKVNPKLEFTFGAVCLLALAFIGYDLYRYHSLTREPKLKPSHAEIRIESNGFFLSHKTFTSYAAKLPPGTVITLPDSNIQYLVPPQTK